MIVYNRTTLAPYNVESPNNANRIAEAVEAKYGVTGYVCWHYFWGWVFVESITLPKCSKT